MFDLLIIKKIVAYFDSFVVFWQNKSMYETYEYLWFIISFGLIRYFLIDIIIVVQYKLSLLLNVRKRQNARIALWIEQPLVSIIVPGKNEGKSIAKLIRSLSEQTYQTYELIVVDDGSTDETPFICRSYEKKGAIDLFIRNEIRGGKASAANTALRFCKGKYIIHLDADSSLNRDAIEKILLPFYINENTAGVAGNLVVRNQDANLLTRLQAIEYLKAISIGRLVSYKLGLLRLISGAYGAFKTEVIQKIGGWDVGPGLDGDITVKLRKLGYSVHFVPESIVQTNVPDSLKALTKQRLRWSRSLFRFRIRKHFNVYLPQSNFKPQLLFSFTENVVFGMLISFFWIIYILDVIITKYDYIYFIFLMNFFLSSASTLIKYSVTLIFFDRSWSKIKLLVYAPLMAYYIGIYLRLIMITATLQEFLFKESYQDTWNPLKTSLWAKEKEL